jgi:Na+-translocating ferredoxin:NAD+ oxidoreductase RnfE subunit
MSTNRDNSEPQTGIPPRFQFGLSTLMWITTVTGIVCALSFTIPGEIAIPIMLFISVGVLPAVWTTVIVYGRGYQRTFGIGALFPSSVLLLMVPFGRLEPFRWGGMRGEEALIRMLMLGFWVASLLVGVVCIGVRKFLEKLNPSRKP